MGFLKSGGSVGLDIDAGVIRAVELKGRTRAAALAAAGRIEIPAGAVEEGAVADVEVVAGALKELWKDARIGSRDVIVGVSNQVVLMRIARLPKVPANKLEKVVRFQAGDYFPIPLEQLVLDFFLIGEVEGGDGPEMEVLLVAARRENLGGLLDALSAASLRPLAIDASSLALLRTLPGERQAGAVAMLDLSTGRNCSFMIAENGVPRLARSILQFQPAAAQKNPAGLFAGLGGGALVAAADDGGEKAADESGIGGWVEALANEVRASIAYYLSQRNVEYVEAIVLSGSGARMAGLPEMIQEELDVPVEIIKPLAVLGGSVPGSCSFLSAEEPDFAVSIGLAVRGLEHR
ncbi:tfp pilus assembly protein, ATPase PilM [Pelotomaculum thermopropionicum SI]|uniref:Tfp pilus assembly protein, ATPase PilM n=1 Tax=Pelotomaculum thermopropionicum (strain DSM 13744 / JCM 10971 / SI) TaxID=370438 RepID=A5D357_PELTS|nr:tfp pilus assembly protein, ATPase PilM [Pelotomaculum thermopropionicum SI]